MHRFSAKHRPMCLDQARILLAPPLLPGMTMNLGPISHLPLPCTSRFKGRGVYLQLVSEPHFRKSFAIHESSRFQFICVHLYWTLVLLAPGQGLHPMLPDISSAYLYLPYFCRIYLHFISSAYLYLPTHVSWSWPSCHGLHFQPHAVMHERSSIIQCATIN